MLRWNKALWLDVASHMIILTIQRALFNLFSNYATLTYVYDIGARLLPS